jgi:hypothetical protein
MRNFLITLMCILSFYETAVAFQHLKVIQRATVAPSSSANIERTISNSLHQKQQQRMNFSIQAKKKEPAPKAEVTEKAEKSGIEPKYLAAVGVFAFAVLYDFFITHGGQPYLAHPPSV